MAISTGFYFGAAVFGLYPLYVSAIFSIVVAFGQSRKQQGDLVNWAFKRFEKEKLKPKQLVYPAINLFVVIWLVVFHNNDAMQVEVDYSVDSILLFLLGFLWVTQPAHLRTRDMYSFIVIACCIRFTNWFDN